MKETIITLDAEDIFTMVRESDTKLFSADSISADTVSVLCSNIRKRVVERKIITSGSMAVWQYGSTHNLSCSPGTYTGRNPADT